MLGADTASLSNSPRHRRAHGPRLESVVFTVASPVTPVTINRWPSWLAPSEPIWRSRSTASHPEHPRRSE